MRMIIRLIPLVLTACTLSNRTDPIKALCGINEVNTEISYLRLTNPEQRNLIISAEFIDEDGRVENLIPTPGGCLALPQANGLVSARASSNREWVAVQEVKKSDSHSLRELAFQERGHAAVSMSCPEEGFRGSGTLKNILSIKDSSGNLQNLSLAIEVSDKKGQGLGTLFTKNFGSTSLDLPEQFSLAALDEGEFALSMNVRDSFFGDNPKSLLVSIQCPLIVQRSCDNPNDSFDPDTASCRPKLCDDKFRVGEFWSEPLANGKGKALLNCILQDGNPVKVATDASCDAGYFESKASCMGAKNLAAGLNHSCAVLENGTVSCWGYNVFGTLGAPENTGSAGQVLGPQAPVALAEAAQAVSVSSVSSCALLESGRVQCWGYLSQGVSSVPQWVRMADGTDLKGVKSLRVGGGPDRDTYCVVTESQIGLCWGKDLFSRSQTMQFGSWLTPRPVFSDRIVQELAVTDREICALDSLGSVACMGSGLAIDSVAVTPETLAAPIAVNLPTPAQSLSSQQIGKCAVLVDGRLFCWGLKTDRMQNLEFNFSHGVPDIARGMTPAEERPRFAQQVKEIGLNGEISCVLTRAGKPTCQLGSADRTMEFVNGKAIQMRPVWLNTMNILGPDDEVLTGLRTMAVGFWHGCGVHETGQVYCWGNNQFGRLGNGTIGESGLGQGIPRSIHATLIQAP